ncbi:hypothetical protein HZH68_003825 [Vespula germanica]|uniref:Uncharacterized protein n=1 Tax=Vespula germanica TaxID=30212 RepID=A0A834NIU9_VESGE|nr:hypothetical protein HZH68_003825 [Vespula germanica]
MTAVLQNYVNGDGSSAAARNCSTPRTRRQTPKRSIGVDSEVEKLDGRALYRGSIDHVQSCSSSSGSSNSSSSSSNNSSGSNASSSGSSGDGFWIACR